MIARNLKKNVQVSGIYDRGYYFTIRCYLLSVKTVATFPIYDRT